MKLNESNFEKTEMNNVVKNKDQEKNNDQNVSSTKLPQKFTTKISKKLSNF